MASPLSILKSVLNLNHNCMYVCSCEQKVVTVHHFGETFEQLQRIECPEHGVLTEYIPWADGTSRFTPEFNNEIA